MKGKAKHIVGIVLSAILLPAGSYLSFMFYVIFALAYDLNGGMKGEGIGTALALTIVGAVVAIASLVFLILCSVSLAKIKKKEKMEKAQIIGVENAEASTETSAD